MCSSQFYRRQAHRCVMLSRATPDPKVRLWLTDMASQYVEKAEAAQPTLLPRPGTEVMPPALSVPRA
jgi:hypothetical protein